MKKTKHLILIILLIIIVQSLSYGEDLNTVPIFEWLGHEEGLENLSISAILQDKYGFMWIGTQGGLHRYDGREMTIYRNDPFDDTGLLHNLIQTLYYDEKLHQLWVGTYQGLSRLDIETNHFTNFTVEQNGLSNSVVVAIAKDQYDKMWVGTLEGLNSLDPVTGKLVKYDVPGGAVRSILLASDGNLYIGTYEGLYIFNHSANALEKVAIELPSKTVMVVKEFETGTLTIGMWDGGVALYDFLNQKIKKLTFEDNRVYTLEKTDDATLWVGTWGGGLFKVTNDKNIQHFEGDGKVNHLSHPIVYSLFEGSSEILWVGTNGGGLNKVNQLKQNYLYLKHDSDNPETSLSPGKINAIHRTADGGLWVSIYNSGLNRYDENDKSIEKLNASNSSLMHDNIIQFLEYDHNRLLLATGAGVQLLNTNTRTFEAFPFKTPGKTVYALEWGQTNELWIGTYLDGLYAYDTKSEKMNRYFHSVSGTSTLSDNLVYDILKDTKGRLWVGTNNGLNKMEKGSGVFDFYYRKGGDRAQIASNTIRVLFEDSQGNIWLGSTGGGISRYVEETDSFVTYTEKEGLSNNTVLGILEDKNGNIWASTQNGISVLSKDGITIEVLNYDDGIGGFEFNTGSWAENDGMLLFGGNHGITGVSTDYEVKSSEMPSLYVYSVELFQKPLESQLTLYNGQMLTFKSDENYIGFRYVALDYDTPLKTKFYHQLIGQDSTFIEAGTRDYASYSNLSPGRYTFKVYAETSRGIISEEASVQFVVKAPLYLTWPAFVIYGLMFFLLIVLGYRLREGKLIKKQNSELALINEKLEHANETLEALTIKDALTGAFNRRYFERVIEQQLHLAMRGGTKMTIMMIDIDDFKRINDENGHIAGDNLLKEIAHCIEISLHRSTDFVSRYGGDEFIVGLFDTDSKGAVIIAESIQKCIQQTQATVSIGVCTFVPTLDDSIEHVVQIVDESLYKAKRGGKNKIVIH